LPLLLKPDGNGKLSKRDADMYGFPVFPLEWKGENGDMVRGFREDGYSPEAMVNFLAMLGWNPGTNQELFTMDELIKEFSLEKISKSGAKFDINKAKWFNQQYLKQMSDEVLGGKLLQGLKIKNIECSTEKAAKIAHLLKERVVFDNELTQEAQFFFFAPESFSEEAVKTKWNTDTEFVAKSLLDKITTLTSFSAADVKAAAHQIIEEKGLKLGKVMPGVRMVLTGATSGPDLMEIIEVLGKEEVIKRLKIGIEKLSGSLVN